MEEASSEGHKCPKCGAEVLGDAVGGLCPACLMAVQMGTQTHLTDDPTGPAGPKRKAASPEDIAEFFPQFEIIECLGRGGMGAVYKARQKSLNRLVALKILAPEREGDAAFAKRFAREAETLAKLNHPNIVTVHDFGDTNGMFYLVMEFVDGVNLRSLIHERKLSPEEALTIVPPICEALQFAHELGIVHRDIKPENLLLDKKGRVKIADFGIAKIMGTSSPHPTDTGVEGSGEPMDAATRSRIVGTPQYMAPEQRVNPSMVDHRADIFSLGVVFYEMLTGTLPSRPIDPPSRKLQVDVRLDEVVLRALEESPERRFQTADFFKTELETVATSLSGSSRREEAQILASERPLLSWKDLWSWEKHGRIFPFVSVGLALLAFYNLANGVPSWVSISRGVAGVLLVVAALVLLAWVTVCLWVGRRIRFLISELQQGEIEFAQCWTGRSHDERWPFNDSPAVVVLNNDHLKIIPVWGESYSIPFASIVSCRMVRWYCVNPMIWKRGLKLQLANGRRIALALPRPYAERWFRVLGGVESTATSSSQKPGVAPAEGMREVSRIFSSSWLGGVAALVLILAYSALAIQRGPKDYSATAAVRVDRTDTSELLENTYATLVSAEFLRRALVDSESPGLWEIHGYNGETDDQILARIQSGLTIRAIPLSRNIEIEYVSRSPSVAAAVANALARQASREGAVSGVGISLGNMAVVPTRPMKSFVSQLLTHLKWGGLFAVLVGVVAGSSLALLIGILKRLPAFRDLCDSNAVTVEENKPLLREPPVPYSRLSFGLLLCVLLGTPLLLAVVQRDELVLISSGLALLLAVVFGGLSWRHRLGKASAISATLVIIGILVTVGILSEVIPVRSWTNAEEARRDTLRMEAELRRVEEQAKADREWKDQLAQELNKRILDLSMAEAQLADLEAEAHVAADSTAATAPPVVVSTFPISGDDSVDVSLTEISVTFSKPMLDRSWSFSQADDETAPELVGEPSFDADLRTCTVPVSLEPGRTYALWLNSENFQNFKDASGEPSIPYLLIFKTKVEP